MSKNKFLLAAAGAGKTTYLINEALSSQGNIIILTYTENNRDEIKSKFIRKNGYIPSNVSISTWFSFLIKHGVKPYQSAMHPDLGVQSVAGLNFINGGASGIKYTFNGRSVPYSGTKPEEMMRHYFDNNIRIYSDKLSKFVVECNKNANGAVVDRISKIYDKIFIDEAQDMAGYDLEFFALLMKSQSTVTMVGDPRQVIYKTHHSTKNSKYREGKIKDWLLANARKISCDIDEATLNVSHRCHQHICEYSSLLYPMYCKVDACSCCRDDGEHCGVFILRKSQTLAYLDTHAPMQLKWDARSKIHTEFPSYNMGEAKGLSFDRVLIYPTGEMANWLSSHSVPLPPTTRAKFYVALTRARHSVAIVIDEKHKLWKNPPSDIQIITF